MKKLDHQLYLNERIHMVDTLRLMRDLGILNLEGGGLSMRLPNQHILTVPTGSAFRLWEVRAEDIVVTDMDGHILQKGEHLAVAEYPLDLHIYRSIDHAGAIFHAHSPYCLAFAAKAKPIPATTIHSDTIAPIPCFTSTDEWKRKQDYLANPYPVDMPEAVVQRPEVFIIFEQLCREFDKYFGARLHEIKSHALAFTVERHGAYSIGKSTYEAIDGLLRAEAAARTAILSALIPSE